VERNAKFLSNLTEADQYTAENAMQNEDPQEDIKPQANIFTLAFHISSLFLPLIIISSWYTIP
jgi:hypothetical protein